MHAVPDIPSPRPGLEDLRGLSHDLEVLVRAVRDLVALRDEIDAGLGRRGIAAPSDVRARPSSR